MSIVQQIIARLRERGIYSPTNLGNAVRVQYGRTLARRIQLSQFPVSVSANFFSDIVLTKHAVSRQGYDGRQMMTRDEIVATVVAPHHFEAYKQDPQVTDAYRWIEATRHRAGYWLVVGWQCDEQGTCIIRTAYPSNSLATPTDADLAQQQDAIVKRYGQGDPQ